MIEEGLKDPRVGAGGVLITITGVEVAPDLRDGTVFYSVIGDADAEALAAEALEGARHMIYMHLRKVLRLKYTPRLRYRQDNSIRDGVRILELLEKARLEKERLDGAARE